MPKQLEDVIITDFYKGIADSPHLGFADMRNLDVYSTPGVAKIGLLPVKDSSTTITALVKWIVKDPTTGYFYALDSSGNVYTNSSGSWALVSTRGGTGEGIAVWKDYLFVAQTSTLDVYGPLSGVPAWSNDWQTLPGGSSGFRPIISGQDDILYIGNGKYVSSVAETSGSTFAPGTGASYTYTSQALTLPSNYIIKCMAEFGRNLMIGASIGSPIFSVNAKIFPWDRSSTSYTLPIDLNEAGVHQLLTVGSTMYIHAGLKGRIYATNGFTTQEVRQVYNLNINVANGEYVLPFPGAMTYHDGKILFGMTQGAANEYPIGVYGLKGRNLTFENSISTGNVGDATTVSIGAIYPKTRDTYWIAWRDGSSYGIDVVGSSGYRYTSYAAYFDSPLYSVGLPLTGRTFTEAEFQLAKPLTTGQGVKLQYRKDLSASWTTLGTYDYATYGGVQNWNASINIDNAQFIQVRGSLTTGSSSATTPELKSITLR